MGSRAGTQLEFFTPPSFATLNCEDSTSQNELIRIMVSEYVDNSTYTTCQNDSIFHDFTLGSRINCSDLKVIIRAYDNCDNETYTTEYIEIIDNKPPSIISPIDTFFIRCDEYLIDTINSLFGSNFGILATDNCSQQVNFNYNTQAYDIICPTENIFEKSIEVKFDVTDDCDNILFNNRVFVKLIRSEVSFTSEATYINENSVSKQICLSIASPNLNSITKVTVQNFDSTAQKDIDYFVEGSLILEFQPMSTEQCFTLTTIDDNILEQTEVIQFFITNVEGDSTLIIGDQNLTTVLLIDNDDIDDDGVINYADNCIDVYNPEQLDIDDDGIGDLCDDANTINSLMVIDNDILLSKVSSGLVIRSANGKCWKIIASNFGDLKTFEVICPEN